MTESPTFPHAVMKRVLTHDAGKVYDSKDMQIIAIIGPHVGGRSLYTRMFAALPEIADALLEARRRLLEIFSERDLMTDKDAELIAFIDAAIEKGLMGAAGKRKHIRKTPVFVKGAHKRNKGFAVGKPTTEGFGYAGRHATRGKA